MTLDLKNKLADARIRVHVLEREQRAASVQLAQLEAEYERATEAGKADTARPPAPAPATLDLVDGGWL